jgi:formylglycine-generating enzyme required for sulfatase activity
MVTTLKTILVLIFWLRWSFGPPCPEDMAETWLVCMDRYEAPNRAGVRPMVMQSALDAQQWCREKGKRLCTEWEWDWACHESHGPCNNDKRWMEWDRKTANSRSEVVRLWQGSKSGAFKECHTPSGIYDLQGNVEEWVVSYRDRDWPFTLKGGWWAKVTACHKSNDAHEPQFRFYQTGFRCCL